MSSKEYVFGKSRTSKQLQISKNEVENKSKNGNENGNENETGNGNGNENGNKGIKNIILSQYDKYIYLKNNDQKIKKLSQDIDRVSLEIINNVGILQNMKDKPKDQIEAVNVKTGHLNILSKKLKDDYNTILHEELKELYERWPDIYEMVVEGTSRETLEDALTVFESYSRGELTAKQSVRQGGQYMRKKYNLPEDFLNEEALDEYAKDL